MSKYGAWAKGAIGKSLLAKPSQVSSSLIDNHYVFSAICAGDPVSYPGNDLWGGRRWTNEGAYAGASNLMTVVSGKPGNYEKGCYTIPNRQHAQYSATADPIFCSPEAAMIQKSADPDNGLHPEKVSNRTSAQSVSSRSSSRSDSSDEHESYRSLM